MELNIVLMGALVGLLVGLTGVGGAALLTPLLVFLGIQPTVAVATDLFYNSITKLFGSIQHVRQKTVNMTLVKHLAMGSVPSAIVAVLLLKYFPPLQGYQDAIIKHALGIVLIIVAILSIVKVWFTPNQSNKLQEKSLQEKKAVTILIGILLGFIVGLTSIGSGSLFALAMMFFYRLKAAELVGTDIVHAFLLVSAAGIMHAGFGNIDYMLAFNLLIGSVPGVLLGSSLSAKVPAKPLRTVMATIILISGIKLI
ncbi:sulfite exporter TauE/SafE family protein [Paenibacillus validus]|uniref:Probable membrane transporter protein n=1 Tax=Paenibacillus validus TaxID=44253 RepID=A0A7X2Z9S4_9BACL|nr:MULTISPECIES: sulfite exporter TauE/SafE family protein [Paenibacillus]MED4599929.1 sulfite exporter TauE/SafE family protein [Paenibacillus validus]MED4605899.1 sulfite exporter TauE/SafE family protein [Paenibacillus validus]MUG70978.1 TSUP family transporter [Paenibacillus validus]